MSQVISQKDKSSNVNPIAAWEDKSDKHFIEDALFQKLLAIREEIYQATEIDVSPRKLVNLLLKEANFNALRDQLIQQYS